MRLVGWGWCLLVTEAAPRGRGLLSSPRISGGWPLTMHIHCRSCLFYRHSQFLTQKYLRFYTWFRKKSTFTMYNWINFHIRWCKVHIFLHWVSVSREVQFSEFLIKCSPRLVSAQPRDPGDVSKGISNRNGSRASHSSPGCSFPFQ